MIAVHRFSQEVTKSQNKPKVPETGLIRKTHQASNCIGALEQP